MIIITWSLLIATMLGFLAMMRETAEKVFRIGCKP